MDDRKYTLRIDWFSKNRIVISTHYRKKYDNWKKRFADPFKSNNVFILEAKVNNNINLLNLSCSENFEQDYKQILNNTLYYLLENNDD